MCCSATRYMGLLILCLLVGLGAGYAGRSVESEFAKPTIDIGVVVSDIEASTKFYTEAIGFDNSSNFSVPGDFAKSSGLTSGAGLDIQVFTLGSGEGVTSLKLMEVPEVESAKVDHTHITTSLGYSYLSIYINSTDVAMKRLEKAGVKPVGKTTAIEGTDMFLTLVRDPDGNLVELLGPK